MDGGGMGCVVGEASGVLTRFKVVCFIRVILTGGFVWLMVLQADEMVVQGDDDLKKMALKMVNVRPDQRMYDK